MQRSRFPSIFAASVISLLMLLILSAGLSAQAPVNSSPVANSSAGDAKDPSPSPVAANDTSDVPQTTANVELQNQVQDALSRVPELSSDSLHVAALPGGLELTGTVVTGRERQAAVRIAQSFARGGKVVDHIVVSGRSAPATDASKTSHQANAQP
ncbi:MAG TPA: BON domain-containing protein [Candidatus Angelobacter sp.]|nr:BON domain-containing protein [Candidatus Angelobacter sp.]